MLTSHNDNPQDEPQELFGPVVGGLIIAIGLSGILDDTDLLPHPWWVVLLVSLAIVGLLLGARTLKMLLDPDWKSS